MNLKLTCGCGLVTEFNYDSQTSVGCLLPVPNSSELKIVKEQRDELLRTIGEIGTLLDGKIKGNPEYKLTLRIKDEMSLLRVRPPTPEQRWNVPAIGSEVIVIATHSEAGYNDSQPPIKKGDKFLVSSYLDLRDRNLMNPKAAILADNKIIIPLECIEPA